MMIDEATAIKIINDEQLQIVRPLVLRAFVNNGKRRYWADYSYPCPTLPFGEEWLESHVLATNVCATPWGKALAASIENGYAI